MKKLFVGFVVMMLLAVSSSGLCAAERGRRVDDVRPGNVSASCTGAEWRKDFWNP
jgi:hypothetical protein